MINTAWKSNLASGTFGAVYRATHLAYGSTLRSVAIKIAKRPMQPSEARHAFHDALTMARVVDEAGRTEMARRFVAVYDAGFCPEGCRFPGHPYMVMEYVTGTTLADCVGEGSFHCNERWQFLRRCWSAWLLCTLQAVGDGAEVS